MTIEFPFKEYIKEILNKIGVEVSQVSTNRILEYQVEEFNRSLFSKTLLHRAKPVKLDSFYVPLFLKTLKGSIRIDTSSIKTLTEVKGNFLTIIGDAGSGKSTLVKSLFLKCTEENFKIPIKVELRYLNDYNENLSSYINKEIFQFNDLSVNDDITERLLDSGKFFFFFDGYDELNAKIKSETTIDIDRFVKRYSKNSFIITSRPDSSIELLPLFKNFAVCKLTKEEIVSFIKKQLPKQEQEVADKIISAVQSEENKHYESFLSNPLLLSMFILTFQSYSKVPPQKSIFYRQVFETLYTLHDSISKLSYDREKQSGLSKGQFEEVLKMFSFLSFFDGMYTFKIDYFDKIVDIIKKKKPDLKFDNQKLAEDLSIAIGIIQKDGLDYTFPHRSLQEYFAALYVDRLEEHNKALFYEKLENKISDFTGNLGNFFSILQEIDNKKIIQFLYIPFLSNLLEDIKSKKCGANYFTQNYFYKRSLIEIIFNKKLPEILNVQGNLNSKEFKEIEAKFYNDFKPIIEIRLSEMNDFLNDEKVRERGFVDLI